MIPIVELTMPYWAVKSALASPEDVAEAVVIEVTFECPHGCSDSDET